MAKMSLSRAWDETKAVLTADAKLYVTVALALLVLPTAVLILVSPQTADGVPADNPTAGIVMLAALLIGLVARLALARMAIGPATSVGSAILHGLRRLPWTIAAFLIFVVPMGLISSPFLPRVLANPRNPPPDALIAVTVIMLVAFVVGIRMLSLVIPAAAAEESGPLQLLRRSWDLTKGHWWRLAGFFLLFFVASQFAGRAVTYTVGTVLTLAMGRIEAFSVSALILALVLASVAAAITVVFTLMLARLYAEAAGEGAAEASVPSSGS